MSEALKKESKKLLALAKGSLKDIRKYLKKASRNTVRALSEISYNIVEKVVSTKNLFKEKLVQLLAGRKSTYTQKQKRLRGVKAARVVKEIIITIVPILTSLVKHG